MIRAQLVAQCGFVFGDTNARVYVRLFQFAVKFFVAFFQSMVSFLRSMTLVLEWFSLMMVFRFVYLVLCGFGLFEVFALLLW